MFGVLYDRYPRFKNLINYYIVYIGEHIGLYVLLTCSDYLNAETFYFLTDLSRN